jgi:hypothetical protein
MDERAFRKFFESEEEFVFGIKQAQTELNAGLGISHDDVVKQSEAYMKLKNATLQELKGQL